jgi:hypothetical protein
MMGEPPARQHPAAQPAFRWGQHQTDKREDDNDDNSDQHVHGTAPPYFFGAPRIIAQKCRFLHMGLLPMK